ncbi:XRE family transcriptional regulator [Proteus mirabilis]|uniref:XRE family transcriptional regulator n=1 Tax=Proteus mirabilis TaxID=584 RepID=UPI001B987C2F|nr:helix-turn-helix transcriptional regulator [Proteus mirabilis]MCI9741155.1 helix-turn-helix transcriptional regulator [Proteus mirabilis]MCI9798923.1 helix-turn-helix transcriptional regulator [Proteus mirabilis]MCI9810795.1 helix-turn-helix transcriptional regulator [Proteus mirabilis]MDM3613241.1 helix-turn-helix transcriptional regulator [Proteus mirabilis]UHD48564.1 helix-turn-helix transcriptional regulator [Proteus mirabilis]
MKTFSDRLNFAMRNAGLSQADLAQLVGVAQPTIWKLTTGKSQSSRKSMEIAEALGVDPVWLTTGNGEPFSKNETQKSSNMGNEIPVKTWSSDTLLDDDEVEVPFLKDIEFACGAGACGDDDYNGYKIRFSKSTLRKIGAKSDGSDVICFPVRGNSMEPILPDGSTVGVNISDKRIHDGKIYAINQDGWKRIKLLYRTGPETLTIRSYNSEEYPEETVDIANVEVIGRVFWCSVLF